MLISAIAEVTLAGVTIVMLRSGNKKFKNIIMGDDNRPSLAVFQFLVWTVVILFSFFTVYLVRVMSGFREYPHQIPANVLVLMGISAVVPIASGAVTISKRPIIAGETPDQDETADQDEAAKKKEKHSKYSVLAMMLQENGRPSLSRFQMFAWTWISVAIYFVIFSSQLLVLLDPRCAAAASPYVPELLYCDVSKLTLPDIDPSLVILMGLSQGAYLGVKAIGSPMEIAIYPNQASAGSRIHIIGPQLGPAEHLVMFRDREKPQKQHIVEEGIKWTPTKIVLNVPKLAKGDYHVIVVTPGGETRPKEFKVV